MISIEAAQDLCLAGLMALGTERVALTDAAGRTLATMARADRAQPPFAASSMDGYAIIGDGATAAARYQVIGEAAAGHAWSGTIKAGQALRIFTGAPIPEGATRVIIQEDVIRDGDDITLRDHLDDTPYIRPAGADFAAGFTMPAPRILSPLDIALCAAMNVAEVTVARKPTVALIATGDELVMPGGDPRPDQIVASNIFGLQALVTQHGGTATILPIAADTPDALRATFQTAMSADMIVTIGGASVGDHDLVGQVATDFGLDRAFYKIAMRPGKPLMSGRLRGKPFLGLPGNPVSAMVCGYLFLIPMLRKLLGQADVLPTIVSATLGADVAANGARAHYMRAVMNADHTIVPAGRQDSALLTVLASANALLIRPVNDPTRPAGHPVSAIRL